MDEWKKTKRSCILLFFEQHFRLALNDSSPSTLTKFDSEYFFASDLWVEGFSFCSSTSFWSWDSSKKKKKKKETTSVIVIVFIECTLGHFSQVPHRSRARVAGQAKGR